MYVTNVTDDYDNITNNYDNITFTKCTNNENNIDIIIPTLLLRVPCGLSLLCMLSLMIYTLIKHLITKK